MPGISPVLILAACGGAVALVVSLALTPRVRRLAFRRGWVDRPDGERKLHALPTPSVGGLAIVGGAVAGGAAIYGLAPLLGLPSVAVSPVVLLGALAMVGVGLWDDVRGLGFKTKLAVEIVVAYALLLTTPSYLIDLSAVPFIGSDPYSHALFAIPVTLLWFVGVMNAINLIDGIDGLAAGVAAIAFASLAVAFGLADGGLLLAAAVVMVGSLLGFLRHNFNPASIFMGDSGSLFIGYALAVYTLSGTGHADPLVALAIPVLALGLPVFDTVLSMVRRAIGRQAIMAPDRDHIHHRMTERMPVRRAVLLLYLVAGGFGTVAIGMSLSPAHWAPWWIALAIVGAAAFATTLGYARRPYIAPVLIDTLPEPTPLAMQTAPTTESQERIRNETETAEKIGTSGDGTIVAAGLTSMSEMDLPSDVSLSSDP